MHSAHAVQTHVYLAGPIAGCNLGEANDWRAYVSNKLRPHGIIGVSPLRCEPIHGERYSLDYPDPRFGTSRAIAAKNLFDVNACPFTLAYLPVLPPTAADIAKFADAYEGPSDLRAVYIKGVTDALRRVRSYGTIGELFWANGEGKRTILVSDDPYVMRHPVIDAATNWKLESLDEACDVLIGVLGAYSGGKHV